MGKKRPRYKYPTISTWRAFAKSMYRHAQRYQRLYAIHQIHEVNEEDSTVLINGAEFALQLKPTSCFVMDKSKIIERSPHYFNFSCILVKISSTMPFAIYVKINWMVHHDKAQWDIRSNQSEEFHLPSAFQVLAKFVSNDLTSGSTQYGSLKHFAQYLNRVDICLTKLAFHPERDEFFRVWKRVYEDYRCEKLKNADEDKRFLERWA